MNKVQITTGDPSAVAALSGAISSARPVPLPRHGRRQLARPGGEDRGRRAPRPPSPRFCGHHLSTKRVYETSVETVPQCHRKTVLMMAGGTVSSHQNGLRSRGCCRCGKSLQHSANASAARLSPCGRPCPTVLPPTSAGSGNIRCTRGSSGSSAARGRGSYQPIDWRRNLRSFSPPCA